MAPLIVFLTICRDFAPFWPRPALKASKFPSVSMGTAPKPGRIYKKGKFCKRPVDAEGKMKKLASILLVMSVVIGAAASDSQAGWKKRGWYLKRPGANCVLRKVVVSGMNGKVVVRKVRVCR